MKTRLLFVSLLVLACGALAQADPPTDSQVTPITVSIKAKGTDVKTVLGDLFTQAHKNYVIQPDTFFALHLALANVDFDEALMIVSKLANLKIELQNGIYYVSRIKPKPSVDTATTTTPKVTVPPKLTGTLPKTVLAKKLTTRFAKTDMRQIFAEISKQTGVPIDFDKSVPAYKLDAILKNTSLRYALDQITEATGLAYRFTDTMSILIYKPAPGDNQVRVAAPGG